MVCCLIGNVTYLIVRNVGIFIMMANTYTRNIRVLTMAVVQCL